MNKSTLKTLSDDELSHLDLLVQEEQEARFSAAQKAAEKERKSLFAEEKKRMAEIKSLLDKNVKVEWNGIKLTFCRVYRPEEADELEYWVQKYSGPRIFDNDNGCAYSSDEVRQIAPELVKGDLKLVKEYYRLKEKVEGAES